MSIKLKQPTMRLANLFFFVNLVMWWNGHLFCLISASIYIGTALRELASCRLKHFKSDTLAQIEFLAVHCNSCQ